MRPSALVTTHWGIISPTSCLKLLVVRRFSVVIVYYAYRSSRNLSLLSSAMNLHRLYYFLVMLFMHRSILSASFLSSSFLALLLSRELGASLCGSGESLMNWGLSWIRLLGGIGGVGSSPGTDSEESMFLSRFRGLTTSSLFSGSSIQVPPVQNESSCILIVSVVTCLPQSAHCQVLVLPFPCSYSSWFCGDWISCSLS